MRNDGRANDEIRNINVTPNFLYNADGSILFECNYTRVICSASIIHDVPPWMKAQKLEGGWLTAEYQLLPSATPERGKRERNGLKGRTQEIQRLIGRSLRAACDLKKLPQKTIYIDCDVIDADGGTRCASISGGMIALKLAIQKLLKNNNISEDPIKQNIAAISMGLLGSTPILDLCYTEDSQADVDMNLVMDSNAKIVEIQGAAEGESFTCEEMTKLLDIGKKGIKEILYIQNKTFEEIEL